MGTRGPESDLASAVKVRTQCEDTLGKRRWAPLAAAAAPRGPPPDAAGDPLVPLAAPRGAECRGRHRRRRRRRPGEGGAAVRWGGGDPGALPRDPRGTPRAGVDRTAAVATLPAAVGYPLPPSGGDPALGSAGDFHRVPRPGVARP